MCTVDKKNGRLRGDLAAFLVASRRDMGIILFLVDTSASMNQKTYLGTSYLDVAKVAIETFMKVGLLWVELPMCMRKCHLCLC